MGASHRLTGVVALAVVGAVLGAARPATACFEVDSPPAPYIHFTSAATAEVSLEGMLVKPTGIAPGDFCAVGLGHSGSTIVQVTAVSAVDDADPTGSPVPIAGLSFTANATTTSDLGALPPPPPTWQGFHSGVTSVLPGGTYVALVFSIDVVPGTTYADIIDELQGFAFVGVDDANAGGNLAGTSQAIEGILGNAELSYCFDDVVQPGETCDGASHLGCVAGDACVDCSVCVAANLPNKCKSRILRDVGNNAKQKLKCYAKTAKLGQPVAPSCLSAVFDLMNVWLKYQQSCPQTLPPHATITTYVDDFDSDVATLLVLGGTSGAWKCAANKFKATSYRAVGQLKCHSKAVARSQAVDPLCLSKVDVKYGQKFARAEAPGQCDAGNVGNAAAVAALADQLTTDVVTAIPPP